MDLKTVNNNNNISSNNHLRIRRTKSVSVAQVDGVSRKEYRLRAIQPDKPVHKFRDSLLSSSSGYTNYRGFLNLCIILLVLSNARLVLENIIKYGILIDPIQMFKVLFLNPSQSPSILILLGLFLIPSVSLGIEKLLSKGIMSENMGLFCIVILVSAEVLSPPVVVYLTDCNADMKVYVGELFQIYTEVMAFTINVKLCTFTVLGDIFFTCIIEFNVLCQREFFFCTWEICKSFLALFKIIIHFVSCIN